MKMFWKSVKFNKTRTKNHAFWNEPIYVEIKIVNCTLNTQDMKQLFSIVNLW